MARVVTTGIVDGASAVVGDRTAETIDIPLMPGSSFTPVWSANSTPRVPNGGETDGTADYFPPPGGFRFGIFVLGGTERAGEVEHLDAEAAQKQVAEALPGLLDVMEPDAPGMHTSQTVDCVYVLDGRVTLELDDDQTAELEAGDTVVQNGTRHAWRNLSPGPCTLLIAVAGADEAP